MNKKTALTILTIVIVVAILLIGFFLFFQKQTEEKNPVIEAARNFFGGFFPSETKDSVIPNQNNNDQNQNKNSIIPKLRQISSFPVAGGVMFEREATTSSLLVQEETGSEQNQKIKEVVYRFVERSTGHIYETTSRDLSQKRITNTTIPKIYQAIFSPDGESLIMVYLNSTATENFIGKINYPTLSTSTIEKMDDFANITGTFLPSESFGFTRFASSSDFAFMNTTDNQNGGYITNLYTGNIKTPLSNKKVLDLETSEWKVQILKNNVLTLNTKSSVVSEGFLYYFNPENKSFIKKIGNTIALNSNTSPDGKKIFYSYNDSGVTKNVLFDSDTKLYTTIQLSTFPAEKCVWSQKDSVIIYCAVPVNITRGDFPDIWYQGQYSFNDSFVKINTKDFTVESLMVANSENPVNLDAVDLQLSPNEDYLMFINKSDLILWSLDII